MSVKQPEMNVSGNGYSIDDIQTIAYMVRATDEVSSGLYSQRDLFPTQFVAYAIQKEMILSSSNISAALKNKLENAFSRIVSDAIDEGNNELEKLRNEKHVHGEKEFRYRAYDKENIIKTISNIIDSMRQGFSVKDAIAWQDELLWETMLFMHNNRIGGYDGSYVSRISDLAQMLCVESPFGQIGQFDASV